ncbi:MAG TPA: hypothetical protein VN325_23235 [Steroidobacteraceae bacterium]|nr:hypothetical protein [Steroidobacteraceae bacterium]
MSDIVEIRDSIPDIEQIAKDIERYHKAAHAVQSGIAMLMNHNDKFTTPKHLRVGIDLEKAELGGLTKLLVDKGLITRAEYFSAIADGVEREKAEYEQRLSEITGAKVTLV